MKKTTRLFAALLVLAMVAACIPAAVFAADTTNADGYIEVRTVEDLYNIRNDLTANYILMNDIDLTAATAEGGDWDYMGNGWNPIGSGNTYAGNAFSGEFDGNGHKITGIRIDVTTLPAGVGSNVYIGLFANVKGTIKDLTLSGNITYRASASFYVGSIAGSCSGNLTNCVNVATINGTGSLSTISGYVGGLVGEANNAQIINCANQGNVSSVRSSSHSTNTICTKNYAGGIAGISSGTTFSSCYNIGVITSAAYYNSYTECIRGTYGGADRWVTHYYEGTAISSGIANAGSINDCYNTGNVVAKEHTVHEHVYSYAYAIGGTASRCYNLGKVSAIDQNYGISNSIFSNNCYYLANTCAASTGATSLTAAQMKLQSMYAGFDFENTWIMNPYANYPYPQLRNNVQDLSGPVNYVTVISLPNKTTYFVGEELDLTGCKVLVEYASGESETITPTADMLSGFSSSSVGTKTVTVGLYGVSDSFTVTVKERPQVTSVELISLPDRTTFTIATSFDFTGAVLRATYADGTTADITVTEDMTSGGNIRKLGTQTITVEYEGYTDTFTVTVMPVTTDLSGTVTISGTPAYGSTLTADVSNVVPEAATYTWQWCADGAAVGAESTYTVQAADIGKAITVTLVGTGNYTGTLTSEAVTATKAQAQTPAAPGVQEIGQTSVTLVAAEGCQYSLDGITWQDEALFQGLTDDTQYSFYQRTKETDTHFASPASTALVITTQKAPTGPKTDPSFKFSGASLSLQHNIAINFKADKTLFEDAGYENPYVVFELNGVQTTVTEYTIIGNRYVFSFLNIAPNQMNDSVSATMFATRDGDLYTTETRTYSVAQYCYSMLELYPGDAYAKLRTLLVDLLNYGAASQLYTGYNADNLVNAKLTAAQKQWATAQTPELTSVLNTTYETVDSPKATWRGAGLKLNDAVSVRLSFRASSTENLKVLVKTDKQQWTIGPEEFVENNGTYYVYFNGLHAGQMRETFYITIYEGNTAVSNTASYSIESYAFQQQNGDDFDLADLVVAMMKYGDSACAYNN